MPLRFTFEISSVAPMFRAATVSSRSLDETPASIKAARNMSPLIPEKQSRYAMRIGKNLYHTEGQRITEEIICLFFSSFTL